MTTPVRRTITIALAVAIGLIGTIVLTPMVRRHIMLQAITADDPDRRSRAWAWWLQPIDGSAPRATSDLRSINRRLMTAHQDAVLDGSTALRRTDLWGWDHQPMALILREINIRTLGDPVWQHMAIDLLDSAPARLGGSAFLTKSDRLLASDDPMISQRMLETALSWLGHIDPDSIDELTLPSLAAETGSTISAERFALHRLWVLACGIARAGGHDIDDAVFAVGESIDFSQPLALIEARLLASVLADRSDTRRQVALAANWPDSAGERPAFASILRYGSDELSHQMLERMERRGDLSAQFALHARNMSREQEAALQVLNDPSAELWRRKLACWRLSRVDEETVLALLAAPLTQPEVHLYHDVLLAEKHLDQSAAADLAEQWIRSFDDGRKQAGALLAALLGVHGDLVQEAHRVEDMPRVRTVQQLALSAMRSLPSIDSSQVLPLNEADDSTPAAPMLAHRSMHTDDGDFDPDILLAVLLSGESTALPFLTSAPRGDLTRSVQQRAWLIERFVPTWHDLLDRPIGGSERGVQLHFDALRALQLLTERSLAFEAEGRLFTPRSRATDVD